MSKRQRQQSPLDDVPLEPLDAVGDMPAKGRPGRPAKPNRSKVTFSIDKGIQAILDRVWFAFRELSPDRKGDVNKSAIVEAALVEMMAEFEEKGRDSKLAYHLLGSKYSE